MQYIYLLRSYGKDKTLVKLGYTSNIKARLNQYSCANPLYEIIQIYLVENALQFEQTFHSKYTASLRDEWYEEDILPIMIEEIESQNCEIYILTPVTKFTFKEVVEEMKKGDEKFIKWAYNKYDFLKEAITHLGYEKIEKLQYNSNLIKKTLLQFSNIGYEEKIRKMLDMDWHIQKGVFVSSENLKEVFKYIYSSLNIKRAAKASDITKYYKTKSSHKVIKGVDKKGYIILSSLI